MEFYGRKKELAQLMKFISSDEMQMSLIYGRRRIGKSELVKQSIKESGLKSIFYYESALFYSNLTNEDKVRIYSVYGGVPYYNRLVDDRKSVRENIIELIASPGARLENEVSMYLNAEISKIVNVNEVFEALAKGFSKFSDILSQFLQVYWWNLPRRFIPHRTICFSEISKRMTG